MNILLKWFVSALAIWITAYIVPGVTVTYTGVAVAAVVLGALNLFIRPILMVLTLPITIITLGFFSLVINAGMVMLTDYFVDGFSVPGFLTALFFALVLSVVNWVFHLWGRP